MLAIDVPQVFANNGALPSEEIGHLRLRQPHRVLLQTHIQLNTIIGRFVIIR